MPRVYPPKMDKYTKKGLADNCECNMKSNGFGIWLGVLFIIFLSILIYITI